MIPLRNKWLWSLILFGLIMVFWTSPESFILIPIWLLRLIYLQRERLTAGFVVANGVLACIAVRMFGHGEELQLFNRPELIALAETSCRKVILFSLFGPWLSWEMLKSFGLPWFSIVCAVFSMVVCVIILKQMYGMFVKKQPKVLFMVALSYIAAASILLYAFSRHFYLTLLVYFPVASVTMGNFVGDQGRYFLLATVVLYLLIAVSIDSLLVMGWSYHIKKTAIILGVIAVISLSLPTFRNNTLVDMQWCKYAALIKTTQQSLESNQTATLKIPINIPGWFIELVIHHGSHR